MEINLKNKTAWVFGGSSGIGRSIALELANCGANIVLVSRNLSSLKNTKDELCVKMNQRHDILSVDMSKTNELENLLLDYLKRNDVDIIINNSGGPRPGLAHSADNEDYSLAFRQHLISAQTICRIVAPLFKKKQFGRIINIISTSVKQPIPGLGVSNTIRGAVANWSKTLSSELGPFGVTVNNILPGATQTERLNEIVEKKAHKNNITKEQAAQIMKEEIPLKRFAQPREVGFLVAFLSSDMASYINGVNIPIDGGRTKSL